MAGKQTPGNFNLARTEIEQFCVSGHQRRYWIGFADPEDRSRTAEGQLFEVTWTRTDKSEKVRSSRGSFEPYPPTGSPENVALHGGCNCTVQSRRFVERSSLESAPLDTQPILKLRHFFGARAHAQHLSNSIENDHGLCGSSEVGRARCEPECALHMLKEQPMKLGVLR